MKLTVATVLSVAVTLGGGLLLYAQSTPTLEGVWQIRETASKGGGPANRNPLPSLVIFTPGHYSMVWMFGSEAPRSFAKQWFPTDAEKIARYDTLGVNSGTYVKGQGKLTMTPIVARVPEFIGGTIEWEYRLSGDVLVLTFLDEHSFDGVQAPHAKSGGGVIMTLGRITP